MVWLPLLSTENKCYAYIHTLNIRAYFMSGEKVENSADPKDAPNRSKIKERVIVLLAVCILLAICGAVVYKLSHKQDRTNFGSDKTACQILTKKVADKVTAKTFKFSLREDKTSKTNQQGIQTSTCIYRELGDGEASERVVKLTLHSAQAQSGIANIKAEFKKGKTSATQDVGSANGESYWNSKTGELSVLRKNTIYTMYYGTAKPFSPDISEAFSISDAILGSTKEQ
jgi:hypothetical protein